MIAIEITKEATATVIHLAGALDHGAFSQFGAAVSGQLGEGSNVIIIDMAKLDCIDESGLRQLFLALKKARRSGSNLLLAQPQERVWDALSASRLNEIFVIHETLSDALSSS